MKLPSVLIDFRESPCIRSGQAGSLEQLKRLSLLNMDFFSSLNDVGCSLHDCIGDQSIPDGIQEGVASNNELECTDLVKFYKS
jgi:hypothetical protein